MKPRLHEWLQERAQTLRAQLPPGSTVENSRAPHPGGAYLIRCVTNDRAGDFLFWDNGCNDRIAFDLQTDEELLQDSAHVAGQTELEARYLEFAYLMVGKFYRAQLQPFAEAARRFVDLLESTQTASIDDLLESVVALYLEGIRLKSLPMGELAEGEFKQIPQASETTRLRRQSGLLGELGLYRAFSHPVSAMNSRDGSGVVGDLQDDVLDIYFDIAPGLLAFESLDDTQLGCCHFEWRGIAVYWHWGEHAAMAIGALNSMLFVPEP